MQETSSPQLWNQIWSRSNQEECDQNFWDWVKRESASVRSRKIESYIQSYVGNLSGLKTVEVGAGLGIYSFIFARLGAEVTLLDYSYEALNLARKRFEDNGLLAKFIFEDALKSNPSLNGQYDVAMSFGTVEHFKYPERFQILEAHVNLVRKGGAVIVSVPNLLFFPHEFLKMYLQSTKKWQLGYEGAFSHWELLNVARKLKLKDIKVVGSSFSADFQRYLRIYRSTNLVKRLIRPKPGELILENPSWIDDFFGADLVLLGIKE